MKVSKRKKVKRLISFVIPCYKSALTIRQVVDEIKGTMENEEFEIVLINDASPDNTFDVIRELCVENVNVIGINLNENFGQHAALMAGFHHVNGDIVVCLDDDGQTPANEAGKLITAILQGHDAVYARYEKKRHSRFRNFGSYINELMARILLEKPKDLYISSYFAVKRFIVDEMIKYENPYPYVIGLLLRSTKDIVNVDVCHREREVGKSGYTFGKLIMLWLNGFTAFSVKPLRIATATGFVVAIAGFVYGIVTIIRKLLGLNYILGFSGLMSVLLFLGGLNLIMLGLIGEYIGRIYISLNKSPQFIIREILNDGKGK
ncbi:glycosyltransferase [bacterium 0.1xD8-71]|nr:glycosyltransferase [bacterium 0.1xD8-71]